MPGAKIEVIISPEAVSLGGHVNKLFFHFIQHVTYQMPSTFNEEDTHCGRSPHNQCHQAVGYIEVCFASEGNHVGITLGYDTIS